MESSRISLSMDVTAYDIALISGGFTIVGALIGGAASFFLNSVQVAKDAKRLAAIKLRESFGAEVALLERTSERENETSDLLKSAFLKHQAAVNEFRLHLRGREISRFNDAWVRYYGYCDEDTTIDQEHFAKYFNKVDANGRSKALANIRHILDFAKPPK